MTSPETAAALSAIAADLQLCDIGLALTRGRLRKRYAEHKRACLAEIERLDPIAADVAAMDLDALARELEL